MERVALVIGNGEYDHVTNLDQSRPDAKLMADTLSALGFSGRLGLDLRRDQFEAEITRFGRALDRGAIGFFYYSGHGVQYDGINYLIPIDAKINDPDYLNSNAVNARRVLQVLSEAGSQVGLVVLDACRENPFDTWWTAPDRAFTGSGLAAMGAPEGVLIGFSTSEGKVAWDASGYTEVLASELLREGQAIEVAFKRAREAVLEKTERRQIPWEQSSLIGEPLYLAGAPADLFKELQAKKETVHAAASRDWRDVDRDDREELLAFIEEYEGAYVMMGGMSHEVRVHEVAQARAHLELLTAQIDLPSIELPEASARRSTEPPLPSAPQPAAPIGGMSGLIEDAASKTPSEKLKQTTEALEEIREIEKRILETLESATRSGDEERLECLSKYASTTRSLLAVTEGSAHALQDALSEGNDDRADHEFRKVVIAQSKAIQFEIDADAACGGLETEQPERRRWRQR